MRLGSLCSGVGGLDLAVEAVFGATTVWHCEQDAAASRVLAHRWPGIPNHGDLIANDWATVEPVDIVCAGWPCQPFSLAGKRKGADDDRAIWPHIADAVRILRPRIVVLENVSAVLRLEFGRVADSLAALRYDLGWECLRACDVGAPHRRERLFIIATDASGDRFEGRSELNCRAQPEREALFGRGHTDRCADEAGDDAYGQPATDAARDGRHEGRPESVRLVGGSDAAIGDDGPVELFPTPSASDGSGGKINRSGARRGELLLGGVVRAIGRGDLLPTPNTSDNSGGGMHPDSRVNADGLRHSRQLIDYVKLEPERFWGKYESAIRRWESLTRPAPAPTEPTRNGSQRLAAAFSEWMMGWPAGWVTEVPDLKRNDQLGIIGNGVVPQQAAAALQHLLAQAVAA